MRMQQVMVLERITNRALAHHSTALTSNRTPRRNITTGDCQPSTYRWNQAMLKEYRHPALRQLKEQQVRFAPVDKRLGQLDRIEKLLTEITPSKKYPYQYVCFRITDFRTDANPNLLIEGKELEHDLQLFIQDLNETVPPCACRQALRTDADARSGQQEPEGLDQDRQPLARQGPGHPQGDLQRSPQGRSPCTRS